MAYKIRYNAENTTNHPFRIQILTTAILFISLMFVNAFWAQGREVIQEYLLPQNVYSYTAAQELVTNMEEGMPLFEAIQTFCDTIWNDQ